MQAVITRESNRVEVEGKAVEIDLSGMDPTIRSVKWFGDLNAGTVERTDDSVTRITSIAEYSGFIAQARHTLATAGLPPAPTLSSAKAAALALIDAEAGAARARFITVTPGQEMTYQEKARQAAAFKADQDPSEAKYPMIYGEVGITADTAGEVADVIIARYADWAVIGAQIERTRLTAKRDVSAADGMEAVSAIIDSLTWPIPQ